MIKYEKQFAKFLAIFLAEWCSLLESGIKSRNYLRIIDVIVVWNRLKISKSSVGNHLYELVYVSHIKVWLPHKGGNTLNPISIIDYLNTMKRIHFKNKLQWVTKKANIYHLALKRDQHNNGDRVYVDIGNFIITSYLNKRKWQSNRYCFQLDQIKPSISKIYGINLLIGAPLHARQ